MATKIKIWYSSKDSAVVEGIKARLKARRGGLRVSEEHWSAHSPTIWRALMAKDAESYSLQVAVITKESEEPDARYKAPIDDWWREEGTGGRRVVPVMVGMVGYNFDPPCQAISVTDGNLDQVADEIIAVAVQRSRDIRRGDKVLYCADPRHPLHGVALEDETDQVKKRGTINVKQEGASSTLWALADVDFDE